MISTIWIKNLGSIVNKMSKTKSLMISVKPKDRIKLDIVKLDKTYPEKNVLHKDVLCRHLYGPL